MVSTAQGATVPWLAVQPDLALVTSDLTTPIVGIVERYAGRWTIKVAFADARQATGVGRQGVQKPRKTPSGPVDRANSK
ncbi:hypothetical protein [Dactylosporangium sp. NPDC000521]|uniref:hypothetical protein n=1 Tax=Dactylosporangium sp. NPDC000521 TaxID=3363975 RepID=UPI003674741A